MKSCRRGEELQPPEDRCCRVVNCAGAGLLSTLRKSPGLWQAMQDAAVVEVQLLQGFLKDSYTEPWLGAGTLAGPARSCNRRGAVAADLSTGLWVLAKLREEPQPARPSCRLEGAVAAMIQALHGCRLADGLWQALHWVRCSECRAVNRPMHSAKLCKEIHPARCSCSALQWPLGASRFVKEL